MKVLLADDQVEIRSALRLLLDQRPGLTVTGEAVDEEDLIDKARETRPDLVLLDWELPAHGRFHGRCGSAIKLMSSLRAVCPGVKVIALSGRPEAQAEALSAGAEMFVSKGEPPERLLEALRAVCGDSIDVNGDR